jgi:hypothetical protein
VVLRDEGEGDKPSEISTQDWKNRNSVSDATERLAVCV